jgi:hypothetical protein
MELLPVLSHEIYPGINAASERLPRFLIAKGSFVSLRPKPHAVILRDLHSTSTFTALAALFQVCGAKIGRWQIAHLTTFVPAGAEGSRLPQP